LSGRSVIWRTSTLPPSAEPAVSTSGACPLTVSVSSRAAGR
jgi:hypothetical protein